MNASNCFYCVIWPLQSDLKYLLTKASSGRKKWGRVGESGVFDPFVYTTVYKFNSFAFRLCLTSSEGNVKTLK